MHAHAHLGVVGVFILMIVTVSYKLVPMFTLGELQSECQREVVYHPFERRAARHLY